MADGYVVAQQGVCMCMVRRERPVKRVMPTPLPSHIPKARKAKRAAPPPTERHVRHGVDDDAGILGDALRHAAQPALHHVVPVEEAHLRLRLHPHLVLPCRDGARGCVCFVRGGERRSEIWLLML